MSQTPEPSVPATSAPAPPRWAPPSKPDRLYQVAAWVAIVAGMLLIVMTVLFFVCAFWCCI